jgi:Xaa-Pro aminopeptidase
LITWDKNELPPEVFERRAEIVRKVLKERQLSALVVYSDLWRSNQARFFANYMPYFNRALLILPLEGKPTLLCGLSPRTYRWIQSVTPIEDVRSAGNFVKPLTEIATERGWSKVGVLDLPQLPYDLFETLKSGGIELVDVESSAVFHPAKDEHEIAMRRKAAAMARAALEEELPKGVGKIDYEFVGDLERRLRMEGAEDLVILLSNGAAPPAPAHGRKLEKGYSVSLALEYRGHWVRILRPNLSYSHDEEMAGAYPYECRSSYAIQYSDGDTRWLGPKGWERL